MCYFSKRITNSQYLSISFYYKIKKQFFFSKTLVLLKTCPCSSISPVMLCFGKLYPTIKKYHAVRVIYFVKTDTDAILFVSWIEGIDLRNLWFASIRILWNNDIFIIEHRTLVYYFEAILYRFRKENKLRRMTFCLKWLSF